MGLSRQKHHGAQPRSPHQLPQPLFIEFPHVAVGIVLHVVRVQPLQPSFRPLGRNGDDHPSSRCKTFRQGGKDLLGVAEMLQHLLAENQVVAFRQSAERGALQGDQHPFRLDPPLAAFRDLPGEHVFVAVDVRHISGADNPGCQATEVVVARPHVQEAFSGKTRQMPFHQ